MGGLTVHRGAVRHTDFLQEQVVARIQWEVLVGDSKTKAAVLHMDILQVQVEELVKVPAPAQRPAVLVSCPAAIPTVLAASAMPSAPLSAIANTSSTAASSAPRSRRRSARALCSPAAIVSVTASCGAAIIPCIRLHSNRKKASDGTKKSDCAIRIGRIGRNVDRGLPSFSNDCGRGPWLRVLNILKWRTVTVASWSARASHALPQ